MLHKIKFLQKRVAINKTSLILLITLFASNLIGQNSIVLEENINISWNTPKQFSSAQNQKNRLIFFFEGTNYTPGSSFEPMFEKTISTKRKNILGEVTSKISNAIYENCTSEEISALALSNNIKEALKIETSLGLDKGKTLLTYKFCPIIKQNGTYKKLVSGKLTLEVKPKDQFQLKSRSFANTSILSSGNWHKIATTKTGVHKIDKNFFSQLGLDVANINPQNIRIYGNGGGMLPFDNNTYRHDDLKENNILVVGQDDGVFNDDDYVLFYATAQTQEIWNESTQKFERRLNDYSDTTFYFINTDLGPGQRIQTISSPNNFDLQVTSFPDYLLHEDERNSLINSGRIWYGESFDTKLSYTFDFLLRDKRPSSEIKITTALVAHSVGSSSTFNIKANNQSIGSAIISPVTGSYEARYAWDKTVESTINDDVSNLSVGIDYTKGNNTSLGWLNYIEVNYERELKANVNQLIFTYPKATDFNKTLNYSLNEASDVIGIWDVSEPTQINAINFNLGSTISFNAELDTQKTYVAFKETGFLTPSFKGAIENQNLHAIQQADYVIVTHPDFLNEANDLALFHSEQEGYSTAVVTTNQLYNEFSSGAQDITAIKDFMKMLYDRAQGDINKMPRYLLLFGDGSFDNKNRLSVNYNFVPTYQSASSLVPADNGVGGSYISDDYFGLLDDSESDRINELIDIGIGRFPVRTKEKAIVLVSKVKKYYEPQSHGNWRNDIIMVADDEDSNMHMDQADAISDIINEKAPVHNIQKVFFDAYLQENAAGGARYPDVNNAIKNGMDRGSIFMTYTGHGGELGWGHERVLTISEINEWTNSKNMPVMLTATCEFSRFDNPYLTSAGELVLLNPDGGAIGLLTTTRLVYAGPNFVISQRFFENAFNKNDYNEQPTLGDLVKITKILGPKVVNTRNFSLLGDPAVRLAYPKHKVYTTSAPDTLKSLGKATFKGYIGDENGVKIDSYNGIIYPTVFDKAEEIKTVNNDGTGVFEFNLQKTILFKGKASVKNGEFEFSFVVPKDIDLEFDSGKVSYYVTDEFNDGNGYYEKFQIGGIDENAASDDKGPQIDLYMNNESFVFGGITNENPSIYALLSDDNGINTTGNGIGHDIVAVIDDNTADKIVLNEYYESELDSYQKGSLRFPLENIQPGKHTISLKAWDVHNNSGEAYTEFFVAIEEDLIIDHLLNYPNPFTTKTGFFFDHNQPGIPLEVSINIFTVSGRLVKTITGQTSSNGFRAGPFEWDGKDEYQDQLAKGVYVYKVKVTSQKGETIEKMEKLVILK